MRKTFSKLFISLVIPIAIFFVLAQPTSAQSEPYYLHLDQNTVEKGYTVPSRGQDFLVGIRPDVFAEPLTVKIVQENAEDYNLPAGKKLVSPIYTYDLRMDNPQVLARPIIVGLKMSGYFPEASLYFFNRVSNSFQPIPTNFDQANQWARAFIHFPYTTIAVLADSLEAQFL